MFPDISIWFVSNSIIIFAFCLTNMQKTKLSFYNSLEPQHNVKALFFLKFYFLFQYFCHACKADFKLINFSLHGMWNLLKILSIIYYHPQEWGWQVAKYKFYHQFHTFYSFAKYIYHIFHLRVHAYNFSYGLA